MPERSSPQAEVNRPAVAGWPAPWVFAVLSLPLGVFSGVGGVPMTFLLAKAGVSVGRADFRARFDRAYHS